jgi:hypothetical protein
MTIYYFKTKKMRNLILAIATVSLFSCAPALPQADRDIEIAENAQSAERAAVLAEQSMRQAKFERMNCEEILKDAREILTRVQVLDNQCKNSLAKIKKARRPIIIKKKEEPVAPPKAPTPSNLEYSPSDAPIVE